MVTIIYEIDSVFNMVSQETIHISDQLVADQVMDVRLADKIPLVKDDWNEYITLLRRSAVEILKKIGYATEDIDYPYYVTDETDASNPDSIIFQIALFDDAKHGVILPILQQEMCKAIVGYIVKEWLKIKGFAQQYGIKENDYQTALKEIKSALMYGQRGVKTYRTL